MYAPKSVRLSSVFFVFLGLIISSQLSAQIEAIGQCAGVSASQSYSISITGIPGTPHTIIIDGAVVGTSSAADFTSNEFTYGNGTGTNVVQVVSPASDTTTILVHEVLCVDVNQDGTFDFDAAVCDYTKPLGTGGAIVSTVAPYNSENVYLYVLTGADKIYVSGSSQANNMGLFEDLPNGGYEVFAFNFLTKAEADAFLAGIPDGSDMSTYVPPGQATCFAFCGSAVYNIDCQSIVDIYVDPTDYEVLLAPMLT